MSSPRPSALVVVLSDIESDPRVQREIDWLASEGWVVDSVGVGEPPPGVREHFSISAPPAWTQTRWGKGLFHAILTNRVKFRLWGSGRFPALAGERVRAGTYDRIVFNDIELLPWIADERTFTADVTSHIHVDLHEFFPRTLPKGSLLRFRVESYFQWTRSFIGSSRINSRSVVASGIADLYAAEFRVPRPFLVRNCPPLESLEPGTVSANTIKLIHHGRATPFRGLHEIVDAMRLLDDRFTVTFLLTGSAHVISELGEFSKDLGDRVRILPPVPMSDIAREINRYDLELMFFPPVTENLRLALPNKLFEAIQARLGLVIGESPMMVEIVKATGNGIIVPGWAPEDLANALNRLTSTRVSELKQASHRSAAQFSAEHEKKQFLAMFGSR